MASRKTFLSAVAGFLCGAVIGIGLLQLQKRGISIPLLPAHEPPAPVLVDGLSATCLGGSVPRVMLLWQGGTARAVSIDRWDARETWESVTLTDGDSHTYMDPSVVASATYRYRLSVNGLAASNEAAVSTAPVNCGL